MLKDIRGLGEYFKKTFPKIESWPELTFNSTDMEMLKKIQGVKEVTSHSITVTVETNHSILPSQYVLYAVYIKEFAEALKDHVDFFENFKVEKTSNQIGEEITSKTFDLSKFNLDAWSNYVALKPFTDSEYRFDSKSIINGSSGSYKIRGNVDFFSSVVLKVINVPDASSAILGKFIYWLCENRDLYTYLSQRFRSELPFLLTENNTNKFAYRVFEYLHHFDGLKRLFPYLNTNKKMTYSL
jgi:hypothetical protein